MKPLSRKRERVPDRAGECVLGEQRFPKGLCCNDTLTPTLARARARGQRAVTPLKIQTITLGNVNKKLTPSPSVRAAMVPPIFAM